MGSANPIDVAMSVLVDANILAGNEVGPSGVTWQNVAATLATNLEVLASLVRDMRNGKKPHGQEITQLAAALLGEYSDTMEEGQRYRMDNVEYELQTTNSTRPSIAPNPSITGWSNAGNLIEEYDPAELGVLFQDGVWKFNHPSKWEKVVPQTTVTVRVYGKVAKTAILEVRNEQNVVRRREFYNKDNSKLPKYVDNVAEAVYREASMAVTSPYTRKGIYDPHSSNSIYEFLEAAVNAGSRSTLKPVVQKLASDHRELQSGYAEFCFAVISEMAKHAETGYFDARNEWAVKRAAIAVKAWNTP